ncbi:MAG: SusC/RagA family TonB-linked outer membrane protein, partial [Bacteroidales bacterium]|nr:SusC/RagA family TonB-linked outer membrane protein [Bacteroidales bacterium]
EDSTLLEETVVVAYGTAKKKDLTGAIGTVDNKAITVQAVGSVTRALDGQVAGLQTTIVDGQPGLDMGIRIRGIGTASANNSEALVVIDGVPAIEGTNPLSSINSKDIESITVLKDAASTALYGARGANGVVLVTTKSGKAGKTRISFEARMGVNAVGPKAYFDKIGDKNLSDIYEFTWESIYNDIYFGKSAAAGDMVGNATKAAEFASQHLFDYSPDGTFSRNAALGNKMAYNVPGAVYTPTGGDDPSKKSATMSGAYLVNPDGKLNPAAQQIWGGSDVYDALTASRFRQEYNISANGGTDKIDYHMSLSYLSDPSYITWSSFDRITARGNVNAKITNWLKAGVNFAYTNRNIKSQSTRWGRNPGFVSQNVFTWTGASTALDHMYALDQKGDFILNADNEKMVNCNVGRNYPNVANSYSPLGNVSTPWSYNLPKYFEQADYSQKYNDLNTKGYLKATFLKYFTAEVNVAYDKTFETLTRFWNTETAHDMNGLAASYGSAIKNTRNEYSVLNTQQLINYNQDINKHHIDALLGHEYYQYDFDQMYLGGAHTLIDDSRAYVNYLGSATYSTFGGGFGGDIQKQTMESYFARANYIYDNKYYVSASVRRDGSSKFKTDENRWGTFWSVGGGWRISSEPWMEGAKGWLDNLKIRGSYGVLGNQNGIDRYSGYQRWSYGGSGWAAAKDSYPSTYSLTKSAWVNDALTWEKVNTADAGIDFTLFGGKLAGTFDWFSKHTKNAVWPKNASFLAAGQSSLPQNTAGIKSTGVEFDLNYQPIKTKDWDLILSVNGTHYNTTLTSLPEGPDYRYEGQPDGWSSNGVGALSYTEYYRGVGLDYYNMYTYKYGGVAGNTGVKYFGTDGQWHTGYTKGDKDAGNALFWHKVTEADASTYGVAAGEDVLVADYNKASRYEMGDAIPELYGGFSAFVRYKGFDLSMQFAYQIGGKFIDNNYSSTECGKYATGLNLSQGQPVSQELWGNTWSESNLDAKYPMNYYSSLGPNSGAMAATGGYAPTDMSMFDASYLSFKNITIGYTFPSKWMNKAKIANLRIYASADNPILISGHSGYDPRRCMTGGLEVGVFSYPYLATYTFGINLDF